VLQLCLIILIQNVMSPYLCTVEVETIMFDNSSSEVLLKVRRLNEETLCDLFISFSELNILLSRLLMDNPHLCSDDLFEELSISSSFTQFVLDARKLLKRRTINLSFLMGCEQKKWIRA